VGGGFEQLHRGWENNSSTSSNFVPLVSGNVIPIKTNAITTMPTNNQYVPAIK
jgi:hypothetical protein